MIQTENIILHASGRTNNYQLTVKQFDKNSTKIICKLSENTQPLVDTDTAKAIAYIYDKTVDIIECNIDIIGQTISFTLTEACLLLKGLLLIDISVFNGKEIKYTFGAIPINVIKSAENDIYNIDCGLSLADKLNTLIELQSFNMRYITDTVTMIPTTLYSISDENIATNVPVVVHITLGGGNSQLVRADGIELIDKLTNKVVDSSMTDIEITAEDIIAGLQMTEGGTLTVKYYNKNCEDLFRRMSNMGNGSKVISVIHNIDDSTTASVAITVEEIEL